MLGKCISGVEGEYTREEGTTLGGGASGVKVIPHPQTSCGIVDAGVSRG